jgi:hypothetical protein
LSTYVNAVEKRNPTQQDDCRRADEAAATQRWRLMMNRLTIAAALVAAATAAAWAPNADGPNGFADARDFGVRVIFVNAPGGDYIQCDPRNPSSPVRCRSDGW